MRKQSRKYIPRKENVRWICNPQYPQFGFDIKCPRSICSMKICLNQVEQCSFVWICFSKRDICFSDRKTTFSSNRFFQKEKQGGQSPKGLLNHIGDIIRGIYIYIYILFDIYLFTIRPYIYIRIHTYAYIYTHTKIYICIHIHT